MKSTVDSFIGSWTDRDLKNRSESLPGYRSLVLYGAGITDEGLALLSRCQKLRELHLVDTCITDAGLKSISRLKSLDWLVIDGANVSDKGCHNLADLRQLSGLQLVETHARDDALSVLLHFPNLAYLESAGHNISGKGLSLIAGVSSLTHLRLASPVIDDHDLLNLVVSGSLRSISLDLPLVSKGALDEVMARLPQCEISVFGYSRTRDKVMWLPSYCIDLYGQREFALAKSVANDVLKVLPFNHAMHSTRALINYQLGNFYEYRKDLESARDLADRHGDLELCVALERYLALEPGKSNKTVLTDDELERLVTDRVKTKLLESVRSGEPIQMLLRRLMIGGNTVPRPLPTATPEEVAARLNALKHTDRADEIFIDLAQFRRKLKASQQGVPWSW